MTERFTGSFTQQEPIPEAAIEAAPMEDTP